MKVILNRMIVSALALATFGIAQAEFNGPAPLAWRWQNGTPVPPGQMESANGTLFLAVNNRVYALDPATGAQKWRYPVGEPLPAAFRQGVTVSGDLVVAAADSKTVFGLSAATGASLWQFTAPQSLSCPPVIVGNLVVMATADGSMISVDKSSGLVVGAAPMKYPIRGTMVVSNELVIYADDELGIQAVDPTTRQARWRVTVNELPAVVSLVVSEDAVYFSSGEYIIGLASANGARRALINTRTRLSSSPVIVGEAISVIDENDMFMSYNRQGRRMHEPVNLGSGVMTQPAVLGKFVGVNLRNGSMSVVDPLKGKLVWNYILRPLSKPVAGANGRIPPNFAQAASAPLLIGDAVALLSRDGGLSYFDAASGVDLSAPTVKNIFPSSGSEYNWRPVFTFAWQIEDLGVGLNYDSIKAEMNGQKLEYDLNRDGDLFVQLGTAKNAGPQDGRKIVEITGADWLGNKFSHKTYVTFDSTLPQNRVAPAPPASGGAGGGLGGGPGRGDGR